MKKLSLILCAAFAIAACGTIAPENDIQETPITVQDLVFDFAVHYPGETKAVKKGWESGDKVFVFFEGVTTGYVTMTHSGSGWGTPTFNGTASVTDLTESGKKLTAIYLPFGSSATASYSYHGGWKFSTTYYSYYMRAEKVAYTVNTTGGITTLSATMDMVNPDDYVQFFIEDGDATDGAYTLGTDAVIPVGVDYIDARGRIWETSDKTYADDMPGYAYSGGYLFSGKLGRWNYGDYYYFAKTKTADNSRADYFVSGKTLESHSAVKLPANDDIYAVVSGIPNDGKWVPVGRRITVTIGKFIELPDSDSEHFGSLGTWCTCNYGCTVPEQLGTLYNFDAANALGVTLPDDSDFQSINNSSNCSYAWLTVHGQPGIVVCANKGFLFLPAQEERSGSYWSSTEYGYKYYFHFSASGYTYNSSTYADYQYAVRPIQKHAEIR